MARMIPERIDDLTVSPAERMMFRELNTQLGTEFLVMHSVHWVSTVGGRNQDGEADFIVAHPDLGVLVIEVKGGSIRRDGPTDTWFTRDSSGIEHELKQSPFLQAERSMYSLRDKLATTPATSGFHYPLARTVAFPDVILSDDLLGIEIKRDMIIDSSNVFLMAKAIRAAMAQAAGPGPGPAGVQALLELVRPSFVIAQRGLAGRIKTDDAEMIQLTNQQLQLLDLLAGHRRIAVEGIAGSGKTILAREHAITLARAGLRVLFTCFNKALAREMRADLAAYTHITVRTYHHLAEEMVREAGLPLPDSRSMDLALYYEEALPQVFADAIGVLDTRFDAIVVDEGQDFADVWWVTLEALLSDPVNGYLAIFYDNNQRIFRTETNYPIPRPHFRLSRNCRCTRHIHSTAAEYVGIGSSTDCNGPKGAEIEIVSVSGGNVQDALRKCIHRLTAIEGIPLEEIVVLSPRSMATSGLVNGARLGNLSISWDDDVPQSIRCRTVHAFKGLEESIVILAELDRAHLDSRDRLIHVALTRARHHVIVLGELPAPQVA